MAKKDEPSYGYGGARSEGSAPDVVNPGAPVEPAAPPIQEYPKVMYRQDSTDRITVNSEAEEDALGAGWYETPTPAEPKATPRS